MKTESIKITGGAVALRNFNRRQLIEFTKVKPLTVASWLTRHREHFTCKRVAEAGLIGRPPITYSLTSSGLEKLAAIIRGIPKPTLDIAFRSENAIGSESLEALAYAQEYDEAYRLAVNDEERSAAAEWRVLWVRAARKQHASFTAAGRDVCLADLELLHTLEANLAKVGSATSLYPLITGGDNGVVSGLWSFVSRCINRVELSPRVLGQVHSLESLSEGIDMENASAGMLAVLGLVRQLPASIEMREAVREISHRLQPSHCLAGIKRLLVGSTRDVNWITASLAVLDGLRQHRTLRSDDEINHWLDEAAAGSEWPSILLYSYAMARMMSPLSHAQDVIAVVADQLNSTVGRELEPQDIRAVSLDMRLVQATGCIVGEVREYAERNVRTFAICCPVADPLGRFRSEFAGYSSALLAIAR